jgi:hypothetical protein
MRVRNRYLLVAGAAWGGCLILGAASYAIVLQPQEEYRHELGRDIAQAKERYGRALEAAKEKDRGELTQQVEGMRGRIADFVANPEGLSDIAFKIGELANATRLTSFSMRPSARHSHDVPPGCNHIAEKRVNVSFSAGFPRFAAFLNALERHDPIIFVETFSISRPLTSDAEPQIDMELAVLIRKPQEE